MRRTSFFTSAILGAALVGVAPDFAHSQLRRSTAGGPPPESPPGTPMKARVPFAGSWEGTRSMNDGPGVRDPAPVVMVFDADEKNQYSGFTILPNNARAPHFKTAVVDGTLTWEQPNSGGGAWHYTARLVSRDRIEGSLILRDWPQGGGATPTGKFVLSRRPAG